VFRADMYHMVPVERRHQTDGYSLLVICNLWREITCTQHYVLLGTELQHCGHETTQAAVHSSITATLKIGSVKPSGSSQGGGCSV